MLAKPDVNQEVTRTTPVDDKEVEIREVQDTNTNMEIKSRQPLKLEKDSKEVAAIIQMVAPALDNNPRKIKQFINLFRLRTYITYETDISFMSGKNSEGLTLEQLGKIVAISLKWPLLLGNIATDRSLFDKLIEYAEAEMRSERQLSGDIARHWASNKQLMDLISFNCIRGKSIPIQWTTYTLKNVNISKLLEVSPKVRDIGATSKL